MSYSAVLLDEKSQNNLKEWALDSWREKDAKGNDIVRYNIRAVDSSGETKGLPVLVKQGDWKVDKLCHHMTIKFPDIPDFVKPYIDSNQHLEAISLGVSDKAIAVRVVGFHSENKIPHITIAINVKGGGKPVDSNKITNWTKLEKPIKLTGIVKELQ
jgi:hypothetical protein